MYKILIAVLFACAAGGGWTLRAESRAATVEAPAVTVTSTAPAQLFSEEESAELQARAEEPGPEVTGGALSNEHLTYIVIALAAAVVVLVLK